MGVIFWVTLCALALQAATGDCTDDANEIIQLFQDYLRIDTTSDTDLSKYLIIFVRCIFYYINFTE